MKSLDQIQENKNSNSDMNAKFFTQQTGLNYQKKTCWFQPLIYIQNSVVSGSIPFSRILALMYITSTTNTPHPFPNDIVEKWHGWNISKEFFSISQLRFWHETINSNPTLQPIFLCGCVHNFVSSIVYMCVLCFCYNNVIISTAYNLTKNLC